MRGFREDGDPAPWQTTGWRVTLSAGTVAGGLRQVAQRAVGLSESERRRALELYLAYQLQGEERQGVPALLRKTLEQFDPGRRVAPAWVAARGPVADAVAGGAGSPASESEKTLGIIWVP